MRAVLFVLLAFACTGCIDAGVAPALVGAPVGTGPAPATHAAVDIEGTTWTMACVRATSLLQCRALLQGSPLTEPLPEVTSPVALNATLSWTSLSPLTDRLAIGVVQVDKDGRLSLVNGTLVQGTSPLRLDLDLRAATVSKLGVHVIYYTRVGTNDANAHFSLRQDWALRGELVSA